MGQHQYTLAQSALSTDPNWPNPMQTHQSLFVSYIVAGVTASWQQVQATEASIPEPIRQQAWHILSFALDTPAAWSVTRTLLLALAPKMEQAGFREDWIPYLEKGVVCAQASGDAQSVAECELQLGLLYRLLSRFDEAKLWTTASVEHFAAQEDIHAQARALNELAWLEQLQHHYVDATYHVEQALAHLPPTDPNRAISFRVKGMIAIGQRQWQQAINFHHEAFILFQQIGDVRKVAWSMQNMGYALKELGELQEARTYLTQAAETLNHLQDHYHEAIVWMNLANVFVQQHEAKPARELLLAAQQVFKMHGDLLNQARVSTNLGVALLELQESIDAQIMFREAAHLYDALGDQIWHINALDGLVMALTQNSQYVEAIQTADEALAILPNIKNSAYYENLLEKLISHRSTADLTTKVSE